MCKSSFQIPRWLLFLLGFFSVCCRKGCSPRQDVSWATKTSSFWVLQLSFLSEQRGVGFRQICSTFRSSVCSDNGGSACGWRHSFHALREEERVYYPTRLELDIDWHPFLLIEMKTRQKNGWHAIMPFCSGSKSVTRFCMFPKVKSAGLNPSYTPVYLNVYDLTPANGYVYWAGLGIFHSGVEVHGVEYAFGAHDFPSSGVFEVEPRQCPGFKFRKSIFMGTTCLDPNQVRKFLERQSTSYNGDTYHLIVKNCNHFCEDICYKLTGNRIPSWVNRLARIGSLCNCILPEALKSSTVGHDPNFSGYDNEKKRLRSAFSCWSSIAMPQKEISLSSLFWHSHCKGCVPPWELKRSKHVSLKKG
ncbi:uncharacterized protein LOC131156684 isoform X2 [Malania oleifera]|uniref:uncharacterized protein LOC131156684 isoform X2 n=1 Tax=Malania oleifera TaxID=397392 RepID=UPI0025AE7122|nr:uncharacterized protein LOC131156684 isoform X2 [Malania oleifera]